MKNNDQSKICSSQREYFLAFVLLALLFPFGAMAQSVLDPVNVARNKPVTASTGVPRYAVDGIATTRWESGHSDPQWIRIDLGATYNINRVRIVWEGALGRDYQVQISNNDVDWTTIRTVTGNTLLINDLTGFNNDARFVRIFGTARGTPWGYSIFELEVYGMLLSTEETLLSLGRPATASNAALPADNAVDGVLTTRWGTIPADPQWLTIDLGEIVNINRAIIRWEGAFGRDYQIQVSNDNENWITIRTVTGNTVLVNELTGLNTIGRFVRIFMTVRGTIWGYSIWELEIFGSAISDCELHTLSVSPSTPVVCGGSSVTLTANNASFFEWSHGLGTGHSKTVSPVETTTYTVIGRVGLCRDTTTVTVQAIAALDVNVDPPAALICDGSSVTLTATGAETFTWSHGLGTGATQTVNPDSTTTFTVIGTTGLCADTTTVSVTVLPSPVISVTTSADSICAGESVTLTAFGADSFIWSHVLGSGTTQNVNLDSTTTFTVIGTTGLCADTTTVTVNVFNVSDLSTTVVGTTITANLAGGLYQWLDCNNNYAIISEATGRSFTAIENGSFAVQITEGACVDTTACVSITSVGIGNEAITGNFIVYPNPTTGIVSIQFDRIQEYLQLKLISATGRIIKAKTILNSNYEEFEINGPAGIYYLELFTSDGQREVVKIIKE